MSIREGSVKVYKKRICTKKSFIVTKNIAKIIHSDQESSVSPVGVDKFDPLALASENRAFDEHSIRSNIEIASLSSL